MAKLGELLRDFADNVADLYEQAAANYGQDKGRREQVNTPGIYADALRGRCTACEDYAEASRYVDVFRQQEEIERTRRESDLLRMEAQRREKLLSTDKLEPFDSTPGKA
jgi:hypothetical protein